MVPLLYKKSLFVIGAKTLFVKIMKLKPATISKKDVAVKLAQSITWRGSKLAYIIGRVLVDRDLENEYYKGYAYFRWVDDIIDSTNTTKEERIAPLSSDKAN